MTSFISLTYLPGHFFLCIHNTEFFSQSIQLSDLGPGKGHLLPSLRCSDQYRKNQLER